MQTTEIQVSLCIHAIRGQLFQINDLVNVSLNSKRKYNKHIVIFCRKNVRIFCNAKDFHIFPTKDNSVFDNVVSIYLMS